MRFKVYTFEFVTHEILFDVQMTYEFFLKFECETESGHSLPPPPFCYPLFRLLKLKQETHFQFFPS